MGTLEPLFGSLATAHWLLSGSLFGSLSTVRLTGYCSAHWLLFGSLAHWLLFGYCSLTDLAELRHGSLATVRLTVRLLFLSPLTGYCSAHWLLFGSLFGSLHVVHNPSSSSSGYCPGGARPAFGSRQDVDAIGPSWSEVDERTRARPILSRQADEGFAFISSVSCGCPPASGT